MCIFSHRASEDQSALKCAICKSEISTCSPSVFQSIVHFLLLYAVGLFHLIRQLLISASIKSWSIVHSTLSRIQPVIILTGSTSGIGLHLLNILTEFNLTRQLILLTHTTSKRKIPSSEEVANAKNIQTISVDFSDYTMTNQAISAVLKTLDEQSYDGNPVLLIHCAAIYNPPSSRKAETTFMVNCLMPMLLLHRLRNVLNGVVVLGSASHDIAPVMSSSKCPVTTAPSPSLAYPASKGLLLGIVSHWHHLSRVPAIVIHPGIVASALYNHEAGILGAMLRSFIRLFAWDAKYAAARILHIIVSAGLFDSGRDVDIPLYWDSVRMTACQIPKHLDPVVVYPCVKWLLRSLKLQTGDGYG